MNKDTDYGNTAKNINMIKYKRNNKKKKVIFSFILKNSPNFDGTSKILKLLILKFLYIINIKLLLYKHY